ncbi:hypothetical protein A2943_02855 [Candidatus Adlerbacteria bacterium RIFCSPLOWO2_01_FULL_51_16]|uniref:Band 7 domain-containing protein n=1 Tax=Candidatus Adlerbacteria bacterium RIFCSPLOWO2_01_FULL_51_16 TaxID=1797243 RepID=A0A1F4XGT1_9BACT|nr:MAG: hypothetical protein A2943_02855 [Candidatus Adlerbacteria bacterium RIFCSPLOWO2_01_FULL_51_16]
MPAKPITWRQYARKELQKERNRLFKLVVDDRDAASRKRDDPKKGTLERRIEAEIATDKTYLIHPERYWAVVILYLTVQVDIALRVWGLSERLSWVVSPMEGFPVNVGLAVLLLQGVHFIASLKIVNVDDLAGIDFFGRPWYTPRSGLYLVPFLLLRLVTATRNYRDVRYPGPPDKIHRVSQKKQEENPEGDAPPADKVRPIFVTTGEPRMFTNEERKEREDRKSNPLDEQANIEIAYFLRSRVNADYGGIFRIIRNIGLRTGGNIDEKIDDLLREQSERDIKGILTKHTPATIIENWELINEVFSLKIQESVMRLGIHIDRRGVGLDDLNPSRETNLAQAEAIREEFRRRQAITKAQGAAEGKFLDLQATARGYGEIKEKLGVSGETVVASETAKTALGERADTLVLGTGGIEQLFGIVKAGQGMLERNKPAPPAPAAAEKQGADR